jgi:membrane protein
LPPRLRDAVEWGASRWPGRIVLNSVANVARIELFDRAMTIAGQFFTSIFPILVLISVIVDRNDSHQIADALNMPGQTQNVLSDALGQPSAASFGLVGALIVLISATSLSRALTRAFATIWRLSRPKTSLRSAWRWLAVVLTLALSLIVVRALGTFIEGAPASTVWRATSTFCCDLIVATFVPWILLSGVVKARNLLTGAALFAAVMVVVRPASTLWLPRALDVSADRYGSIGVAFTYLAWLYCVSFIFLAAAAIGEVLTMDRGGIGKWIRGSQEVGPPAA